MVGLVKRTLVERLSRAREHLGWPLKPVQKCTWVLSDLGWQFPEDLRIYMLYTSLPKAEFPGPRPWWVRVALSLRK